MSVGRKPDLCGHIFHGAERVKPQSLNLDGLAVSRRDDPVTDLGIHPGELNSRIAGLDQPIGIHLDAVASSPYVPFDNIRHDGIEVISHERIICGVLQQRAHGFEVPERRVDRVVFGSFSGIWKTIRQHSPIHVFGEFAQNASRNIEAAGGESQSGQGDHGVAPPIREPRISRNNSLPITPADDVLVGCRRECAHELVLGWSSRSHFGTTLRLLDSKPAGRADIENLS